MKTKKHKKLFKWLLPLMLVLVLPQIASAYNYEVNGLYYNKNSDGVSVTVVGYSYLPGYLEIPSTIKYNNKTYTVTAIGNSAFSGGTNLISVTIPNSVKKIGIHAFYGCTGLTSVIIPNSVVSIGVNPFGGCSGLTSIIVESGNTNYDSQNNCNAIIETATNTLVSGCMNTIIPNSILLIGEEAFAYCSGLTSVDIPNSVVSIGSNAFTNCTGLTSVTIPNSVISIESNAFANCTGLTSVTIPNSVVSIGSEAFIGTAWYNAQPDGLIYAGMVAYEYKGTMPPSTSIVLKDGCTGVADKAFFNRYYLVSIYIPNSVKSINKWAFYHCSGLTSVIVPNSVISIGDCAFEGCSGLTSVTIPNSVASIGDGTFSSCSSLTFIAMPNSVTYIGPYAFYNSGLTSVAIPNSVASIGGAAFDNCSDLTSVILTGQGAWNYNSSSHQGLSEIINQLKTVNVGCEITNLDNFSFTPEVVNCYAVTPPSCASGTFANYDGELHVPTTSIAAYFMADYWQNFSNMVNNLGKVTLDKTNANVTLWESLALTATITPEGEEIIWSSTNPLVATVDENGVVTATGGGECDIYATIASSHGAAYAICHITVSHAEVSISLSEESLDMYLSEERTLTAIITPEDSGLTPTWLSSDSNVATVDENGKVIAVGEGECDITATVLDQTATCHVTVNGDVTLTLNIASAIMGASQMLTVYPSCSPDVPVELVVTSSDPSVAVARVVNRTNAPAEGLKLFREKGMALAMMEELTAPSESKAPAYASEKAIMIVGAQSGTATITVTTADGKAEPAVLNLRVVDVDGDRTITASDITCLYNYLLSGDETHIATSDTDGDGFITSSDITVIYNLLLGD